MLKYDESRVRSLHGFDYGGFEVGFAKGIDRFGKAERGDCIDREASEAEVKVGGFTSCIISFEDVAKAIDLGCA